MRTAALRRAVCAVLLLAAGAARAALDVKGVDAAFEPCADFYAYANRRWLDATEIPAAFSCRATSPLLSEADRANIW